MYKLKNRIISGQFNVIKRFLFNVIQGLSPANLKDHRNASGDDNRVVQYGRSMIEMLGVLAIIAVLSVGGIAGYGKAMRMWTSNQQKEQISQILHSVIRLRYELSRERKTADSSYKLMPILNSVGDIPVGLIYTAGSLLDKNGNLYSGGYGQACWQKRQDSDEKSCAFQMYMQVLLAKTDSALLPSSEDLCVNFINVAKENSQDVQQITAFLGNPEEDDDPSHWRGYEQVAAFSQTTLKVATPLQILNACRKCKNHSYCGVRMYLKTS